MQTYRIMRYFFEGHCPQIVHTGLTLDEAQEHCNNPETDSTTCTSATARQLAVKRGRWFDGYVTEIAREGI